MIEQYEDTIKKLEKRRDELVLLRESSRYSFDVEDRLRCIESELNDLYDVATYLLSPVPRSKVFLD